MQGDMTNARTWTKSQCSSCDFHQWFDVCVRNYVFTNIHDKSHLVFIMNQILFANARINRWLCSLHIGKTTMHAEFGVVSSQTLD